MTAIKVSSLKKVVDDNEGINTKIIPSNEDKEIMKDGCNDGSRREMGKKKRESKNSIMASLPKEGPDGIAYGRVMLRRMTKRVQRGLPPVPTKEEEKEIRREEVEQRKWEERLEIGSDDDGENNVDNSNDDSGKESQNDENEVEEGLGDENDDLINMEKQEKGDTKVQGTKNKASEMECEDSESPEITKQMYQHTTKKKKRSKSVPSDYVCFACTNTLLPSHWIYDCPKKVRSGGKKKEEEGGENGESGMVDPSSRKIFVSGLPFDTKVPDLRRYFESVKACGRIVGCKLLTFEDSKRCKGSGFITFHTDEGATEALKLDGTELDNMASEDCPVEKEEVCKSEEGDSIEIQKKDKKVLRLAVSRVRNRAIDEKGNIRTRINKNQSSYVKEKDHYIAKRKARREAKSMNLERE